jgi:formamidopyrimidine-DNA glycosylase
MPELPDVAGFKRYLDATSLHQRVRRTRCFDERFIKGVSRRGLQRRLKGAALERCRRWGKWLFVDLSSGGELVLHFGMTGSLDYAAADAAPPRHCRLVLRFESGYRLAIISQRMIGRASYTDDVRAFAAERRLGPDALDDALDARAFLGLMTGRRGAVKSALMNQSVVAGIGNVYSDEILFQTGVHPAAKVGRLDEPTLRAMHRAMRRVLSVAARKGGNGRRAPRRWLLAARGPGGACPRCGAALDSATLTGRTAWFCPRCQRRP